ncbi:siderophore-interacting protein [Demequina activiva]|uniref:Siderophore-interacting protein n=1 Tax=Demequina activiva TaxID=1582364 RepID=A0A919Q1P1_9MICO|nr:siderophore-interacting protein [Demequina activiva]GIG53627.1 siderophore-interacting protein [Demequina activiva]
MTDSFLVHVAAAEQISPHLRRVTLAGDALRTWESTGKPDEFVHVHIPDADPAPGWEDDHDIARHYTIRRWDPSGPRVDIDVVTHGHGRGATWARQAQAGDVVAISDAHGYYEAPAGSTRRLLIADATGLPAVARILEEATPEETFEVVVELINAEDAIALPSPATVTVEWKVSGNGRGPSALVSCMERLPVPEGDTYVWVACESAQSRKARKFIRASWPRHHSLYRIVGYWHVDQEQQLAKWNALTPEQQARYAEIWDESRPDEVNWMELEPYLQELGL